MTQAADLSFGRYSRDAMRTLFAARAELARLGGEALEPEHLVLALLRPESGRAHAVLQQLGCPFAAVRERLEAGLAVPGKQPDPSDLPLAPSTIAALEAAHTSVLQIGTQDLLLAVLRQEGSVAATVLAEHGITAEAVAAA